MADYLVHCGVASQEQVESTYAGAKLAVEEAIEFAKAAPEPSPDTLYDGLYSPEFLKSRGNQP
jgi:TPP-dependent pyruvate/acetoin dehydrogenase alpha subunit